MKKLLLALSVTFITTGCQTMKGIGDDISNIDMPDAPKAAMAAPATNPNDSKTRTNAYVEPEPNKTTEEEVDIKRDFPSYHTSPRFDQEPAAK